MAFEITTATVDTYISQAVTAIGDGDYASARRYLTQAETAKEALHVNQAEDGKSQSWGNQIAKLFDALDRLEASESRANRRRTIRVSVGRG